MLDKAGKKSPVKPEYSTTIGELIKEAKKRKSTSDGKFSNGDRVFYRAGYSMWEAVVFKVNKKTVVLKTDYRGIFMDVECEFKVNKDDVVLPDEPCLLIWETWKGVNGRGGYRLDKYMYPNEHVLPYARNNFEGKYENTKPKGF